MTRKCHNHTLQANPQHCAEETQSIKKAIKVKQPIREMIAKLVTTLSTTQQNKDHAHNESNTIQ